MRHGHAILLPVALALAVAACAKSGAGPRGGEVPGGGGGSGSPELEILERFQGLASYVEQSGESCPRLATGIESWLDANEVEVSALMQQARAEPSLPESDLARVEARLERVFEQLIGAVDRCGGEPTVQAAHARFDAWIQRS